MVFGCDGTNSMTGLLVLETCPESCDSCPTDCADNDSSMTPLDCATVIKYLVAMVHGIKFFRRMRTSCNVW